MTTFYRGIKVTENNLAKDKKLSKGGIYRGVKHGAIKKESAKSNTDLQFRGIKH